MRVRAACDAILVGASTVRNDNPRLLVRSEARQTHEVRGWPNLDSDQGDRHPLRRSGPGRLLLQHRRGEKLVYCASDAVSRSQPPARRSGHRRRRRRSRSTWAGSVPDLSERGVRRLMVEGGGTMHTQFLTDDLADELHLVVAPFFVGDCAGDPRFVRDGQFPWHPGRRATLAEVRQLDDVVLLRYALSARFDKTQIG